MLWCLVVVVLTVGSVQTQSFAPSAPRPSRPPLIYSQGTVPTEPLFNQQSTLGKAMLPADVVRKDETETILKETTRLCLLDGWVKAPEGPAGSGCFKILEEKYSWTDAREKCQSFHSTADLASVRTSEEDAFVRLMIFGFDLRSNDTKPYRGYWSGGKFVQNEWGRFLRWSDKDDRAYYTNWFWNQPKDDETKECMEWVVWAYWWQWKVDVCFWKKHAVCKMPY